MKLVFKSVAALLLTTGIASAQDWSIEAFGGVSLKNNLTYNLIPYDTDAGTTYGIGFSKSDVFTQNLEVGFELSNTTAEYTLYRPNSITGLAGMVTAEYNFVNSGAFAAYGGIGLGAILVTYHNDTSSYTNSAVVAGGQVTLGARYAVSDRFGVFVEARYLSAFSDAIVGFNPPSRPVQFNATNIVFGVRTSF